MIANFQGGNGGVEEATDGVFEPFKHCLYYWVCKAKTGPLAGLFKLGISDCLSRRHHEHNQNWEEVDLPSSALVRAESRDVVNDLEKVLHRIYGGRKLKALANATNEELIAAGSCRRHPGKYADGWTEFFTVACLDKMLETTEHLLERWRGRKASACLYRGITPADLAVQVETDGDFPLGRARGPGSVKRRRALQQQEWDEQDARVEAKLREVLDFALAYENDLRWVNVNWWRHLRSVNRVGSSSIEGLVDLYFGPFGSVRTGMEAGSEHRSAAQIRFEESFARLDPMAAPIEPRRWQFTRVQQVYDLQDLSDHWHQTLPHPMCTDTLRLRVNPEPFNLRHPLFEQFEALARRVDSRLVREQMEFC